MSHPGPNIPPFQHPPQSRSMTVQSPQSTHAAQQLPAPHLRLSHQQHPQQQYSQLPLPQPPQHPHHHQHHQHQQHQQQQHGHAQPQPQPQAQPTAPGKTYKLIVRQQPKHSRMSGYGDKVDRRPLDPPPFIKVETVDMATGEVHPLCSAPYHFMYASLCAADNNDELNILKDGKTRSTAGSVVSSVYRLRDIDNEQAGFCVFPDLSVRMEGAYRLKFTLFEIENQMVRMHTSVYSDVFHVYTAKRFVGLGESTFLTRSFAEQGLKLRVRKELRKRKADYNAGNDITPNIIAPTGGITGSSTNEQGGGSADIMSVERLTIDGDRGMSRQGSTITTSGTVSQDGSRRSSVVLSVGSVLNATDADMPPPQSPVKYRRTVDDVPPTPTWSDVVLSQRDRPAGKD